MPPEQAPQVVTRRGLRVTGVVLVLVAATVIGTGIMTRRIADARLNQWTELQAVPTVAITSPDSRGRRTTIDLPGRLEAYSQAQLYARVSGYLKEWKADIGTPVKAGQLLAEIEAPDLDQQIMQAEAVVSSAQANAELAAQTLQRGQSLVTSGAVSKQDLDRRSAEAANQQGLVKSTQANLDRLRVLEKYKRIVAPFDGLVTIAHDRRRLADQRRLGRRPRAVRSVGHEPVARLCQRSAERCAEREDRHQGAAYRSGISGADVPGDRRGLVAVRGHGVRHDAHAARRRQCGR